ncbi:MAG TPA: hypothetical protein VMX76_02225 [Nevskiaceae bacterium]|nr:hypothetical protein [Nevskiaceae bacterium]
MKIGLVTSRGGHLFQLYQLKDWWRNYDRFWLTGRGGDVDYLLRKEKVYYGYFPESRGIINAVRNFFLGLKLLKKEKPDWLISCGAGIAPPLFLAGKLLGIKLIFIEPYDFVQHPSLSARLVAPIVDKLLVQHRTQKKFFKQAEYWGSVF